MSHWMEDAAWRKISAPADSEGLADGERLDERRDRSEIIGDRPPPGKPMPPWRWSPLQPREPSEED